MYDNVGNKLKTISVLFMVLGVLLSIVTGIILIVISNSFMLYGVIIIIIGPILSWIGSLVLYGFGQLVENSDILVSQNNKETEEDPQEKENAFPTPIIKTVSPDNAAYVSNIIKTGKCRLCGKSNEPVYKCRLRFGNKLVDMELCKKCAVENNATPVEQTNEE